MSANWIKSEYSNADCVEVRLPGDQDEPVLVRNSKDPDGSRLRFTRAEWDAFIRSAREGRFDL